LLDALADTCRALADPLRARPELIGYATGRGAVLLPGFVAGLSVRRLAPRRQNDQGNENDPSETSHGQLHFSVSSSAGTAGPRDRIPNLIQDSLFLTDLPPLAQGVKNTGKLLMRLVPDRLLGYKIGAQTITAPSK
jgi:hypothetical protein